VGKKVGARKFGGRLAMAVLATIYSEFIFSPWLQGAFLLSDAIVDINCTLWIPWRD